MMYKIGWYKSPKHGFGEWIAYKIKSPRYHRVYNIIHFVYIGFADDADIHTL